MALKFDRLLVGVGVDELISQKAGNLLPRDGGCLIGCGNPLIWMYVEEGVHVSRHIIHDTKVFQEVGWIG
jgi:hypothetical protein